MFRAASFAIFFVVGCSFSGAPVTSDSIDAGETNTPDASPPDASPPVDAQPVCSSFANGVTPSLFNPQNVELLASTIYTLDIGGITGTEQRAISAFLGTDIVVDLREHTFLGERMIVLGVSRFSMASGSVLRIEGDTPIVIASETDIIIDGLIDIKGGCTNSLDPRCAGPGGGVGPANNTVAATGCGPGENGDGLAGANTPETGGGGGAFGAGGGTGGGTTGGAGGMQCADLDLEPLRGGSAGGAGGILNGGGDGGGGGGAIQLSATNLIRFENSEPFTQSGINANGAGGGPGNQSDGGGGGGSGGGILLEAQFIELDSDVTLAANGGGGGGGGQPGLRGGDGLMSNLPAPGGFGDFNGGTGGAATAAAQDGAGQGSDDDTGGGGGGVGVIRLHVDAANLANQSTISPAQTLGPPCS